MLLRKLTATYLFVCMSVSGLCAPVLLHANQDPQSQFTKTATYKIKDIIDLGGKEVRIPAGSKLKFLGGRICNGTVILDDALLAGDVKLLSVVKGSVRNSSIDADWFIEGNDMDPLYKNGVFYLDGYSTMSFSRKEYVSSVRKRTDGLAIKNVTIEGDSTIIRAKESGTTLESLFSLNKSENVVVRGITFVGSKVNSDEEGGRHNVCISNSENIYLFDVKSYDAFTDGLYIRGSNHVVIENFVAARSGRQGCSITKGSDISIKNSEFSGSYRVAPKSGLDIEPSNRNDIVDNIRITGCKFNDNASNGLVIHLKACDTVEDCNIEVSDCSFNNNNVNIALRSSSNSGKGVIRISGCSLNNSKAVSFQSKCYSIKNTPSVVFEDSSISNANLSGGKDVRENASMLSVHNVSSSSVSSGYGNIEIRNIRFHQDKDKIGKIGRIICLYDSNNAGAHLDNVILDGIEVDEETSASGVNKVYMPKAMKYDNGKSFKTSEVLKNRFEIKGGAVMTKHN